MEIILVSKQIIEGVLVFEDKDIIVKSATVMFLGHVFKELEIKDNKISFEITGQFENGNYELVYEVTVNGKDVKVTQSFVVSNDKIDPSLPVDLQRLGNEV